jgi:hypothetical protein
MDKTLKLVVLCQCLGNVGCGYIDELEKLAYPGGRSESSDKTYLSLPQWSDFEDKLVPDAASLLKHAASPLVASWLSERMIESIANSSQDSCEMTLVVIDWVLRRFLEEYHRVPMAAHIWQDQAVELAVVVTPAEFFTSPAYRALLQSAISSHRLGLHLQEFLTAVALLQKNCLFPDLHDKLGQMVVKMQDISKKMHTLQFMVAHKGVFSFWDDSTDILRHVQPVWDVIFATARYAEACGEVRMVLGSLRHTMDADRPTIGGSDWQDASGAFSAMHYMHRQMTDGWHMDHGLVASLIRLWQPPPGSSEKECHTSIVDFGAGAGKYCDFFNKTGEYCCAAYDGTSNAAEMSNGLVQTQRLDEYFDLERKFDWVMCLEVAEHIPKEAEDVLLGNLRRHATVGLVLSWSSHGEGPHQNAKPWHEVKGMVEAAGFVLDEAASSQLRPQIAWMRGAVHVFRVA